MIARDFDENKSFFLQFLQILEHIGLKQCTNQSTSYSIPSLISTSLWSPGYMNTDNRWIKLTDRIPWDTFEAKYAEFFPSEGYR